MKIFLKTAAVIFCFLLILPGCQNMQYKTYDTDQFSFEHPNTYSVEESGDEAGVILVEGEKGRVEIFKSVERIHGYSSSGLDEFEVRYVPKEKLKSGDYEIWLFYEENDEQTKQELKKIFESFK